MGINALYFVDHNGCVTAQTCKDNNKLISSLCSWTLCFCFPFICPVLQFPASNDKKSFFFIQIDNLQHVSRFSRFRIDFIFSDILFGLKHKVLKLTSKSLSVPDKKCCGWRNEAYCTPNGSDKLLYWSCDLTRYNAQESTLLGQVMKLTWRHEENSPASPHPVN